jgi:hypothetical protein
MNANLSNLLFSRQSDAVHMKLLPCIADIDTASVDIVHFGRWEK